MGIFLKLINNSLVQLLKAFSVLPQQAPPARAAIVLYRYFSWLGSFDVYIYGSIDQVITRIVTK